MRKHKLKQIQSIIEITSSRVSFHSQNYNFIKWDVFTCLILYQRHLVLSLSLSLIYGQQPQYVSLVSSSFFFYALFFKLYFLLVFQLLVLTLLIYLSSTIIIDLSLSPCNSVYIFALSILRRCVLGTYKFRIVISSW